MTEEKKKYGATLGLATLMIVLICLSIFSIWRVEQLQFAIGSLEESTNDLKNTLQNLNDTLSDMTEGLNFTFIETEELVIENLWWNASLETVNITVRNTGTTTLTILFVMTDGETCSMKPLTTTLSSGEAETIEVSRFYYKPFVSGVTYEFALITAKGTTFTYTSTAP